MYRSAFRKISRNEVQDDSPVFEISAASKQHKWAAEFLRELRWQQEENMGRTADYRCPSCDEDLGMATHCEGCGEDGYPVGPEKPFFERHKPVRRRTKRKMDEEMSPSAESAFKILEDDI